MQSWKSKNPASGWDLWYVVSIQKKDHYINRKLRNHGQQWDGKNSTPFEHKKWNPYCIRHSSITSDSDYLPEYALKKKVRWSMNSRQGSRYIKNRMGTDLKQKILEQNGISLGVKQIKYSIVDCPRCQLVNPLENKYCSKCSYLLKPEAYDELKQKEENEMKRMKQQIQMLTESQKEILECLKYPERLSHILNEK